MKLFLRRLVLFTGVAAFSLPAYAQKMPDEYYLSEDGHILYVGRKDPLKDFYKVDQIQEIKIDFPQNDYISQLKSNKDAGTNLMADMTINDEILDSVGVRYKGFTSYMFVNGDKKSFNIELDFLKDNQSINGYSTLNLNNSYDDASFMREVFYYYNLRRYSPSGKANFAHLTVNGNDYGIYQNVQQNNKTFLREWFLTDNGTNWRAEAPPTGGGGGGGFGGGFGASWGDGTSAFNHDGNDTTSYKDEYTLKSTGQEQPWKDFPVVTKILEETPSSELEEKLSPYMDIDKVLWHLGAEILFGDDDSYVFKGKMDYFIYQDSETGRFQTYDYDANSIMLEGHQTWSPFYNSEKENFVLLNKLLAVPNLRQRYLAHMRTMLEDCFDETTSSALLDKFKNMIDPIVQADPIKLKTYQEFTNSIPTLKAWIKERKDYLNSNSEFNQTGPEISETKTLVNGVAWATPDEEQEVNVTTKVTHTNGLDKVFLYYGTGIYGIFTKVEMSDDGQHEDGSAGDGTFGATIPAQKGNTNVRFYIEATAGNEAKTASYDPVGAEHDVFIYKVKVSVIGADNSPVVINEFLSSNNSDTTDEAGENEDWIELHNKSGNTVDLSGYYITDNSNWLQKWQFPEGVEIEPYGYLIVWADENASQGPTHANFKLSIDGEDIVLLNKEVQILDSLSFGLQKTDISYARFPNGTGEFDFSEGNSFMQNNDKTTSIDDLFDGKGNQIVVSPNPATSSFTINNTGTTLQKVQVLTVEGIVVHESNIQSVERVDVSSWASGLYFVKFGDKTMKLIKQ